MATLFFVAALVELLLLVTLLLLFLHAEQIEAVCKHRGH